MSSDLALPVSCLCPFSLVLVASLKPIHRKVNYNDSRHQAARPESIELKPIDMDRSCCHDSACLSKILSPITTDRQRVCKGKAKMRRRFSANGICFRPSLSQGVMGKLTSFEQSIRLLQQRTVACTCHGTEALSFSFLQSVRHTRNQPTIEAHACTLAEISLAIVA